MAARSDFHVVSLFSTFGFFFSVDLFLFHSFFSSERDSFMPHISWTEDGGGGRRKGNACRGKRGTMLLFPFTFFFSLTPWFFPFSPRFHRRQFPPTLPFLFSFFLYRHRRIPFALAAAAIRPRESNYFLGLERWGGEGRRLKWAAEEEASVTAWGRRRWSEQRSFSMRPYIHGKMRER